VTPWGEEDRSHGSDDDRDDEEEVNDAIKSIALHSSPTSSRTSRVSFLQQDEDNSEDDLAMGDDITATTTTTTGASNATTTGMAAASTTDNADADEEEEEEEAVQQPFTGIDILLAVLPMLPPKDVVALFEEVGPSSFFTKNESMAAASPMAIDEEQGDNNNTTASHDADTTATSLPWWKRAWRSVRDFSISVGKSIVYLYHRSSRTVHTRWRGALMWY